MILIRHQIILFIQSSITIGDENPSDFSPIAQSAFATSLPSVHVDIGKVAPDPAPCPMPLMHHNTPSGLPRVLQLVDDSAKPISNSWPTARSGRSHQQKDVYSPASHENMRQLLMHFGA